MAKRENTMTTATSTPKVETRPFGKPIVSSTVTNPSALRYAAAAAGRAPPGPHNPQKYSTPVAGGPPQPVPRLDQPSEQGLTMADQAILQRAAREGAAPPTAAPAGSMFQGNASPRTAAPLPTAPAGFSRPPPGLLPADVLPHEATQDPAFRTGPGSMFATAQPELAYKYGVIRGGQRLAPQQLNQSAKGLRSETLDDLKALADAQRGARKTDDAENTRITQEAAASSAGAAGRLGNAPTDGPIASTDATNKRIEELEANIDKFDLNTFREMVLKDILNNEEQRDIIEARCKPLDLTDLLVNGYVTQKVPIIPGKFEPEFRSMSGMEDITIKRLIVKEGKGIEVGERYLLDKFSQMAVTIGLYALNNTVLPDHRDAHGHFDEDKFWEKYDIVSSYPFHMLASLGVNYFWFDLRVRKLFVADKLGNG